MSSFYETLDEMAKDRDAVLTWPFDYEKYKAYLTKWNGNIRMPSSEEVALISWHKARTGLASFPMAERKLSKAWLKEHGYESWDDGDV